MSNIIDLLESALADEPDHVVDADAIVASARRRVRHRRAGLASVAVAGGAGVAAAAVVMSVGTTQPAATTATARPAGHAMSLAEIKRIAAQQARPAVTDPRSSPAGRPVDGITASSLPGLIEQDAHVRLSRVSVQVLPPAADVNLAAGIASAMGQYLNVQVLPAGTTDTSPPTCAELSGTGADGDGYSGPCSVSVRPGGGYLVERSGRTADGRYAKTEADLVAADGSGIFAEADNQLAEPIDWYVRTVKVGGPAGSSRTGHVEQVLPPVVSDEPPLTSAQLADLVHALNSQR